MAMRHAGHRLSTRRDAMVSESSRVREPYGIAQVYAMAFGVFFVVMGAVGLARSGLNDLTGPQAEVAGLTATPMLSLIHLAVGVIALAAGAARWASRALMTFFGAALIAAGVIALIEPVSSLGWNRNNGIAYLIAGSLGLIAAMMTPTETIATREVRSDYDTDVGTSGTAV